MTLRCLLLAIVLLLAAGSRLLAYDNNAIIAAENRFQRGLAAYRGGDLAQAASLFDESTRIVPHTLSMYMLARTLRQQGRDAPRARWAAQQALIYARTYSGSPGQLDPDFQRDAESIIKWANDVEAARSKPPPAKQSGGGDEDIYIDSSKFDSGSSSPPPPRLPASPTLGIPIHNTLTMDWRWNDANGWVIASIINTSDDSYGCTEFRFRLYGSNGDTLGDFISAQTSIPPRGRVETNFTPRIMEPRTARAEFMHLTPYCAATSYPFIQRR